MSTESSPPPTDLVERLRQYGLSRSAVSEKAGLFNAAARTLRTAGATGPGRAYFVPGRIEVLGKHTDYAGGTSLVGAVERGFCVIAVRREDALLRLFDAGLGEEASFPISPDLQTRPGHWSHYPATVARRLAANFPGPLRGADVAFASDLPAAAGMSSSSAFVVAAFLVLSEVNGLPEVPAYRSNIRSADDLAGYLGTVENGQTFGTLEGGAGVGTFGGSEDHTAILCSRAGNLSHYGYCPVTLKRHIPFPRDHVLAVATSGVKAEKTGAAMRRYNRVSDLVSVMVRLWREETGRSESNLRSILESSAGARGALERILGSPAAGPYTSELLLSRLEHFCRENDEIIPAATEALARLDLRSFGSCVDRSQALAESLLGNQVPQTIFLARSARENGAAAASAFGAGFGGSVYAVVPGRTAPGFVERWSEAYRHAFPAEAKSSCAWLTRPGPSAFSLETKGWS